VRAEASGALRNLLAMLSPAIGSNAHRRQVRDDIDRFLKRPDSTRPLTRPLPTPAGDPIGAR
jgi:hypothetical protein